MPDREHLYRRARIRAVLAPRARAYLFAIAELPVVTSAVDGDVITSAETRIALIEGASDSVVAVAVVWGEQAAEQNATSVVGATHAIVAQRVVRRELTAVLRIARVHRASDAVVAQVQIRTSVGVVVTAIVCAGHLIITWIDSGLATG